MIKKEVSNSRERTAVSHRLLLDSLEITSYESKKSSESSELDSFLLQLFVDCVMIPSLTLCRVKNSHNSSIYGKCGCFHFCIDMYYF